MKRYKPSVEYRQLDYKKNLTAVSSASLKFVADAEQ